MIPQLQTNNGTFYGRYPTETRLLRRYVPSDQGLRVLSFGCSTGEEVLFLKALFPAAQLFGCEHDWANLAAARTTVGSHAVIFDSTADQLHRHGPFDIIVCNSVLLAPTANTPSGPRGLPPKLWSEMVSLLDSVLAPGGIIQIINSNIPFRLHPVATQYTPLRSPLILGAHFVDQFDLDGQRLCSGLGGTGLSAHLNVHLAEPGWAALRPEDLTDTHFQKAGDDPAVPVSDEIVPNLRPRAARGAGTSTYRPVVPSDPRPATFQTVTLDWRSVGADAVRLKRSVVRTWFDGTQLPASETTIDLTGAAASAFVEGQLGLPAVSIALPAMRAIRT
jgi:SAM-dependent methyltransferase